ncbi:unnamed protein product, partial [Hapterophycus canaliculatus]
MMCQKNCGTTVRKALEGVPGVARAEVSFSQKRARVWAGGGPALAPLLDALTDAVEAVGFGATVVPDFVLEVEGMMCQRNCGSTVKAALEAVPGVRRAEVSFADRRALVWGDAGGGFGEAASAEDVLVGAVEAVGFGATVPPAAELEVEGMMCQKNCGTTVRKALEGVSGVTRAEVSFARKRARVWGRGFGEGGAAGAAGAAALVDAVEAVGFGAAAAPATVLNIEGMMCQKNCGTTVRNALEKVPGVSRAEVSFTRKSARVWTCGGGGVSVEALVDAVLAVGFDAS